jgi:hypothetical protein
MAIVVLLLMALLVSVLCGGFLGGLAGVVFDFNPDKSAAVGIALTFTATTLPVTLWLLRS